MTTAFALGACSIVQSIAMKVFLIWKLTKKTGKGKGYLATFAVGANGVVETVETGTVGVAL